MSYALSNAVTLIAERVAEITIACMDWTSPAGTLVLMGKVDTMARRDDARREPMQALSTALVLSVMAALSAGPALAANTQQTKMTNCNAQATAKNLSADARKSFMSSCLSSGTGAQSAATNKSQACASRGRRQAVGRRPHLLRQEVLGRLAARMRPGQPGASIVILPLGELPAPADAPNQQVTAGSSPMQREVPMTSSAIRISSGAKGGEGVVVDP